MNKNNNLHRATVVIILLLFFIANTYANSTYDDTTHLNEIDNNTNDLLSLRRNLEIEKAKAELQQLRSGGALSTHSSKYNSNNANMNGNNSKNYDLSSFNVVVTGVAINEEGRKIAWLQFADGGTLTVDIGSKIANYTVSHIDMNQVILTRVIQSNNTSLAQHESHNGSLQANNQTKHTAHQAKSVNHQRVIYQRIILQRTYTGNNHASQSSLQSNSTMPLPAITTDTGALSPFASNSYQQLQSPSQENEQVNNSSSFNVPPIVTVTK